MSDDLVKRYQLDYHHTRTYAEMAEDCDGDWVKYSDYKAASDRIEELEAKLAKAVDALGGMVGLFSGYSLLLKGMHLKIALYNARAALAELKGQDNE